MIRFILAAVLALLPAAVLAAPTHVRVELVAESDHPAPGQPLTLALVMRPDPGWHDYWSNPGDTGVATTIDWTLPAVLGPAGALAYPVPQTLLIAGLMNHVFEGPHALLVTIPVKSGAAPGTALPISAKVDWLACSASVCVPEHGTFALALTIGDGTASPARRAQFAGFRAALPRPLGATAHVARSGSQVRIAVPLPTGVALASPHLYPGVDGEIDYAAPQTITRNGDAVIIETRAAAGTTASPPASFPALLAIGGGQGLSFTAVPGTVPATGGSRTAGASSGSAGTLLAALGGALLGGLLLNVMPCVFPILSLKALGLARAGGDERAARAEALAYAAGVVLVCLALGAVLLAIRAGGSAAGWAFQLTDPRAILLLLLLVSAIALNLAGLFELGTISAGGALASRGGTAGAFWTGALAAFVATPCAGPFLGVALGTAVTLPAPAALAVFGGLGLGLALPFLAVGFIPALRRRLPRPGGWMETLRRVLSVPMFLTALALAWVLGREAGVNGMALGLLAALVAALGLWWTGQRQARGRGAAWLPAAIAIAVACGGTAFVSQVSAGAPAVEAGQEPFSETRLAALQAAGRPVFVYFTADWCLTCKVNERVAIDRPEVTAAFARAHVATLVGDWTRGDPAIGRFLAAHGRSGVPFYLFYPASGGAPRELPQVLTPGGLARLAG